MQRRLSLSTLVLLCLGGLVWIGSAPSDCGVNAFPGERPPGGASRPGGSGPPDGAGLRVVVLAEPGSEGDLTSWTGPLEDAGFIVDVDASLAGEVPTVTELGALEDTYDVALLPSAVDPAHYDDPVWNGLEIGLVTARAEVVGEDGWRWLETEQDDVVRGPGATVTVRESHSVLHGVHVGDRAAVAFHAGEDGMAPVGLAGGEDVTQKGIVALGFDAGGRAVAQLALFEPGPFRPGGRTEAAGRRALFALDEAVGPVDLADDGLRVLIQTLAWAARPGTPVDPSPDYDPAGLFLTWQRDPATTLTIDWHTLPGETRDVLRYWADGDDDVRTAAAGSHPFPHSDRTIRRVELTGLAPDTLYAFDMGEGSRVFRFRTLPETLDGDALTFVVGGDVRESQSSMERTARHALRHGPAFVVWGGDLAYADGRADRIDRWIEFFDAIKNSLVSREGRVVPIVVAIGNHEVVGGYHHNHAGYAPTDDWRERIAPYFFSLFAFPGHPGYGVLDAGDYLSLVILDSDHATPIQGAQTEWLEAVLAERLDVPHVFPLYHVPAYPSHREYDGSISRRIRETWVPRFEESNVRTVFENHDHTYKRTEALLDGAVRSDGIVFLGDGAWGVTPRSVPAPADVWYLAETRSVRHFVVGTITEDDQSFRAFDDAGRLFDAIDR